MNSYRFLNGTVSEYLALSLRRTEYGMESFPRDLFHYKLRICSRMRYLNQVERSRTKATSSTCRGFTTRLERYPERRDS